MNGVAPRATKEELRAAVLRSVSRSFYLSVRMLPRPVRDPIALAYLLARATDTIADTAEVDAELRSRHLAALAEVIQRRVGPDATGPISRSFAPLQTNPAERALIAALPESVDWLGAVEEADRADIQRVLEQINKGQTLDVQRFADSSKVAALATATELDEYTFLVAGCVGEFWTNVCFRHVPQFAQRPADEMKELGIRYGKGLQLINILRDIGADLRSGRCYLPAEQLRALGVTPEQILAQPMAVEPLLKLWQDKAADGLQAGLDYACAIRPWRVRLATALPALIGARTLALLRRAGSEAVQQRIKIPRAEVRRILLITSLSGASPKLLRRLFHPL